MATIDPAETASRLGQLRDLESELADLHGYPRAPYAAGAALDRIDPATGERIGLGCVIARIRREARQQRQARQLVARGKATRDFLDEPHAQRSDDEVIDEADELLCVTATVKGLRAVEEA